MNYDLNSLFKDKKYKEILNLLNVTDYEAGLNLSPWDFYYFSESAINTDQAFFKIKWVKDYLTKLYKNNTPGSLLKVTNAIENSLFKILRKQLNQDTISVKLYGLLINQTIECVNLVRKANTALEYYFFLEILLIELGSRYLKDKSNVDLLPELLKLFTLFDSNYFTIQTFTSKNPKNNKDVVHASKREKFFVIMTTIYFRMKMYNDVIQLVEKAFLSISEFHESNDYTLKRYQAKAYVESNRIDEAIQIYLNLISQKKDWYLYHELAEIYVLSDNVKEAKIHFIKGFLSYLPDMTVKVNLIHKMAAILRKEDENLANDLLQYEVDLRTSKNWPIKEPLVNLKPSSSPITFQALVGRLVAHLYSLTGSKKGTVKTILPNGKSGFIDDHFFQFRNFLGSPNKIKLGLEVEYISVDSTDRHGKPSKEAIYINKVS